MRPVNLIPADQRRGESAPLRTGALSYLVVGVLALAVAGVSEVVLTDNKISDREAQKSALVVREAAAQQQADALAPYVDFASLQQARRQTVSQLAESRFDWERVLRELAIVIPSDVWLSSLSGSAATADSSTSTPSALSGSATGPTLSIDGCATSQTAVAGFVASLKDIDGVTRVGLQSSVSSGGGSSSSSSGTPSGSGSGCSARKSIDSFQIVAAFDAVPAVSSTTPATSTPPATTMNAAAN